MNTTINQSPTSVIIEQVKEESNRFQALSFELSKIIVGQKDIIECVQIALLCGGHILLEGVPGVAKTTMVKAVSQALGISFQRIQFTPDLLPADLIGTLIFNQKTGDFETKKGPIFANLVLADEINRAPAKVQSALLEAMQERQVTIGSNTFSLDDPFLVFATQNPIEQEGTYRLPEAQLDRFMFKLLVGYPTMQEEREIVLRSRNSALIGTVLSYQDLHAAQELVHAIYVDEKVIDYIVRIVFATRKITTQNQLPIPELDYIQSGASPRATLALYSAARAYAFIKRRHFVIPEDVKAMCLPVLRHRIALSYEAEADGITVDYVINKILGMVTTP